MSFLNQSLKLEFDIIFEQICSQGRIQDFFKEGVDISRGVLGHAPLGKCFISNALKRYFLHFGSSLTTKYQDQNSDFYT